MFNNKVTGHEFSALNQEILEAAAEEKGYESTEVAGYGQWRKAGRQVQKGEKATLITCVKEEEVINPVTGKKEIKRTLGKVPVFFIEQTKKRA